MLALIHHSIFRLSTPSFNLVDGFVLTLTAYFDTTSHTRYIIPAPYVVRDNILGFSVDCLFALLEGNVSRLSVGWY